MIGIPVEREKGAEHAVQQGDDEVTVDRRM
jgi:hypothetical protein